MFSQLRVAVAVIAVAITGLIYLTLEAFGQGVSVQAVYEWQAPTTREDGSALNANEITGYRLTCDVGVFEPVTSGHVIEYNRFTQFGDQTCTVATIGICDEVGTVCVSGESNPATVTIPALWEKPKRQKRRLPDSAIHPLWIHRPAGNPQDPLQNA